MPMAVLHPNTLLTALNDKGKKMPKEFGKKISKAKKGMVGTNKGIPMSEEQKRKISETLKNRNKNGIKKN